jgi:hypothetical protein
VTRGIDPEVADRLVGIARDHGAPFLAIDGEVWTVIGLTRCKNDHQAEAVVMQTLFAFAAAADEQGLVLAFGRPDIDLVGVTPPAPKILTSETDDETFAIMEKLAHRTGLRLHRRLEGLWAMDPIHGSEVYPLRCLECGAFAEPPGGMVWRCVDCGAEYEESWSEEVRSAEPSELMVAFGTSAALS